MAIQKINLGTEPHGVGGDSYRTANEKINSNFEEVGKDIQDVLDVVMTGDFSKTAYDIAVKNGFVGSEQEWLASLKGDQGPEGKSVYDIAVSHGFEGSEEDWLNYVLENSKTVENIYSDARSLSEFISKDASFTVTRRLAPSIRTLEYHLATLDNAVARANTIADGVAASAANTAKTKVESILNTVIDKAGFVIIDSFESGATLSNANDALKHKADGKIYKWAGALPKAVPSDSTPASTGGIAANAWVEVSDTALRQELGKRGGNWLVNNQMAANAYGVPAPLYDVKLKSLSVTPADYFDGYFWGSTGGRVYKSVDGDAWVNVCPTPTTFLRLMPTSDGEVLGLDTVTVRKSQGWGTASVTWRTVLTNPTGSNTPFRAWSFDGNGDKFIANHYQNASVPNWPDSRYVWISTDKGDTWQVVYDTATNYPNNVKDSHLHAACYDPWIDRFWFAEGHGPMVGLYWSDDDGQNWTRLQNDGGLVPQFTVMIPTDFGIVGGTDTSPDGLYVMPRAADPEKAGVRLAGRWTSTSLRHGLYGFADRGFRDPDTGIVYVGFVSSSAEIPPVIMACGASGASVIYTAPPTATGDYLMSRFNSIVAAKGVLLGKLEQHSEAGNFKAKTSKYNAMPKPDLGNILTGRNAETTHSALSIGINAGALGQNSIAIGRDSQGGNSVGNDNYNIALGYGALSKSLNSVAIGRNAIASQINGVAIGYNSNNSGGYSIAVGEGSAVTGNSSIGIGRSTSVGGGYVVAIGDNSGASSTSGSNANSVVIGGLAKFTNSGVVAIGYQASGYQESVAIGLGTISSGSYTVAIGSGINTSAVDCVALGRQAKVSTSGSVAVGRDADASGPSAYNIAIGFQSVANGGQALAIGKSSDARTYGIAIGENAKGLSTGGIAIGRNAKNVAGQLKSIAIGQDSHAGASETMVIGAGASATGSSNAMALGHGASATGWRSVAIGHGTAVTSESRVSIGSRDLESTRDGGAIYLKSPDGTAYKITVSDAGELTVVTV